MRKGFQNDEESSVTRFTFFSATQQNFCRFAAFH